MVNVRVSIWEGRRLDRNITRKTLEDNGISDDDALRVNKLVLPKEFFRPIQNATVKVRDYLNDRTIPWYDKGWRGLMRNGYTAFVEGFDVVAAEWRGVVDDTLKRYPAARALAEFRMVDAYDPNDYPGEDELRGRYALSFDIAPVGTSDDFRVKLDDDTLAEIKDKLNEANDRRILEAQRDVWARVEKIVEHFTTATGPDAQRIYDSTIGHIQSLVAILPSLNIAADPNLKAIGQRLKETLCTYETKDLRKHLDVRAAAKAEAEDILASMRGFASAFE